MKDGKRSLKKKKLLWPSPTAVLRMLQTSLHGGHGTVVDAAEVVILQGKIYVRLMFLGMRKHIAIKVVVVVRNVNGARV